MRAAIVLTAPAGAPDWVKVKNRNHPAMSRVADSFA
jgi:hypothetical protein